MSVIVSLFFTVLGQLTLRGFFIYSFTFLFMGLGVFGPSFFTALNNGLIAALMSFLRVVVFEMSSVLLLPLVWGIDGVWASIVLAEVMAALVTILFIVTKRKKYQY